jgi:hypothetical protein
MATGCKLFRETAEDGVRTMKERHTGMRLTDEEIADRLRRSIDAGLSAAKLTTRWIYAYDPKKIWRWNAPMYPVDEGKLDEVTDTINKVLADAFRDGKTAASVSDVEIWLDEIKTELAPGKFVGSYVLWYDFIGARASRESRR